MADQKSPGRICDCKRREKIVAILERMLQLIELWISDESGEGDASCGVNDVKQIMAILKDMVAVMERLPADDGGEADSLASFSDEELCSESERLLDIIRGGRSPSDAD